MEKRPQSPKSLDGSDMQRPTIAVATGYRANYTAWSLTRALIWCAGGRAIRTMPNQPLRGHAKALVLLGGTDVAPTRYNAPLDPRRRIDSARDTHELGLLASFVADEKPVLGICRGAQLMNVAQGGELSRVVPRRCRTSAPRRRIKLAPTSRLAQILGHKTWANSLHEFAVSKPGKGFRIVSHDAGGVVQAIEFETGFRVGVQWHPELMPYLKSSRRLFRALVLASK